MKKNLFIFYVLRINSSDFYFHLNVDYDKTWEQI